MRADHSSISSRGHGIVLRRVAALALIAALTGCGSAPEVTVHNAAAAPSKAATADDADLVAAVKDPGGQLPVTLHFELQQRPAPGADFSLRLRLESTQALRALQVRYEFPPGLVVAGALQVIRDAGLSAGKAIDRTLRLRAEHEGVVALRAVATAETSPGQTATAVFSIPLIVDAPSGAAGKP